MSAKQLSRIDNAPSRKARPWWADTHQFRQHKPERQKTLRAHRGGRTKEGR
jgi:hypothetical protein